MGLNNNPGFGEGKGYSPFNELQKAAAVNAMGLWDDLVSLSFKNVGDVTTSGWAKNDATILLANTTTGPAQAWAYYPGGDHQYTRVSSDVYTADPAVNNTNIWFDFGGYGNTTLIHELGHTLGLSHPGAYNFGPGFDVNYVNGAEYAQDSMQYSIMSYWSGSETGQITRDWLSQQANYPQTPMLHDIFVIQQKYGADRPLAPATRLTASIRMQARTSTTSPRTLTPTSRSMTPMGTTRSISQARTRATSSTCIPAPTARSARPSRR